MSEGDERVKSLGVAGMALALDVWEADGWYSGVTLDAEGLECVEFTPQYFFSESPAVSPKAAFRHELKAFEMAMGLAISNLMSRTVIGRGASLTRRDRERLLDTFAEEGREELSLNSGETSRLFGKAFDFLEQIYANTTVRQMVEQVATALQRERHLSSLQLHDILAPLRSGSSF